MRPIVCGHAIIMIIALVRGPWCLAYEHGISQTFSSQASPFTLLVPFPHNRTDLRALMANNIVSTSRYLVALSTFVRNALCDRSDTQFVSMLESAQQAIDDYTEKEWRRIIRQRSGAELEVTITSHYQCDFMFMLQLGDAPTHGNFCRRCRRRHHDNS